MDFAWFCDEEISGVVVCKTGVKCPFVSFNSTFSIEKLNFIGVFFFSTRHYL